MTLLTHYHEPSHGTARSGGPSAPRAMPAKASRDAAMRGFSRAAVTILLGTAALAGIIALKAAIYLPHFAH